MNSSYTPDIASSISVNGLVCLRSFKFSIVLLEIEKMIRCFIYKNWNQVFDRIIISFAFLMLINLFILDFYYWLIQVH